MSPAAPAERRSSFYWGFLLLPKDKRAALSAVYEYCRLIDDIVDSGSLNKKEAQRMLDFWKEEVERIYNGTPTNSLSERLLAHIKKFHLPKQPFLEVIRGCEMDLTVSRYETFEELESYLKGVACAVGDLSVEIFGYSFTSPEHIRQFALNFGYAFQLTNIIRDVGADLEIGRVYLPLADMREAGYSLEALSSRDHTPAFTRLMNIQYQRAKTFYRRGRSLVDFRDRPGLLPAEIMAHVYEGLLDELHETGYRVFFEKTSQGILRKLQHMGKAWLYCHGF